MSVSDVKHTSQSERWFGECDNCTENATWECEHCGKAFCDWCCCLFDTETEYGDG